MFLLWLYFVPPNPLIMTQNIEYPFDSTITSLIITHWQSYDNNDSFYEVTNDGVIFNTELCSQKRKASMIKLLEVIMNHKRSVSHKRMVYGCFLHSLLLIIYSTFVTYSENELNRDDVLTKMTLEVDDLKELIEILSAKYFEYSVNDD